MKNNKIILISVCLITLLLSSCSFHDNPTEYPTKSVLFTYQKYNRELVVGEGLKFKLGVVFAGMEKSDRDRKVYYEIDSSLVPTGKCLLPKDYFTCHNDSEIIIPKGYLKGYMPVIIDSVKFLSDPKSMTGEYVLPFRIVSADADTITFGKEFMVLSLKYLAKQFGYYQYRGSKMNITSGEKERYSYVSTETSSVRELKTAGPTTLRMHGDTYGSSKDPSRQDKYTLLINVPTHGGGSITIEPDPESAIKVISTGESTYDEKKKQFTLSYKYSVDSKEYIVNDTLVFRNRIRDDQGNGVKINEWQGF